ncbi:hypothetical protein GWK47_021905 [Chionoecetes opilio]|uniref:Reverse transcriptase n=1 Tax=Chionoecetes opilio TaxID=41210 RepID=A0A8J5CKD4_CHIOP|nr:hypothetical protein GWK47_021905 [Chionoecetes opilio]
MAGGHSKLQPPSNGRHFQGGWDLRHHGGLGVHVHIPHRGQQTVALGPLPPPPAAGPSGHGGVFIPWNGGWGIDRAVTTDRFLDVPAHRECPEAAKVQGGGDVPLQRQLNLAGREVPFKARAVRAPHRRHDERVLQYRVQGEASGVSNKDTSPAGLPPCQHDAPWLAISHFLEGGGGVLSRPPEKELPGGGDIHLEGEPKLALQPPNKLIGAGKVVMPDDPPHRDGRSAAVAPLCCEEGFITLKRFLWRMKPVSSGSSGRLRVDVMVGGNSTTRTNSGETRERGGGPFTTELIPEAQAYADDCTLAFPCDRRDWQDTVCRINLALDNIVTWSSRWQVSLAPDKTQALLISRRQDITNLPVPDIRLEGRSHPLQRSISILGVEFDAGLTFTSHARRVAKNSAWRLSCVRRISHLLDAKGVEVLYKAQKRRAVAGLCVMHKALNLHTPHLAAIKLPRPPPPLHSTRVAPHRQEQVTVPFSRTEHHLRSFLPRYGRLWNQLVHQTDLHHHASLQDFKRGVNSWLMA